MSTKPRAGSIITFYSYKGGTGRSQLLANVAMILASNDRKVAVIDWDLEAPGLHRYFRPFLPDPDITDTLGVIDMVGAYWDRMLQLDEQGTKPDLSHAEPYLDILRYATTLNLPTATPGAGQIVLISAGRQNAAYADKVSNFDWDAFYTEAGGRGFLDEFAKRLRAQFDYVLIDSRTGVSDTAGICTLHLPDDLVVCFTYNNQNLDGAVAVAAKAATEHRTTTRARPLRIFPVPTRADYQLPDLLRPRRALAQRRLGGTLHHLNGVSVADYWRDVEQAYLPVHSYFETLACLTDDPKAPPPSLLLSSQAVARHLTDGAVNCWIPVFDEATRERLRDFMADASSADPAHDGPGTADPNPWHGLNPATVRPVLTRLLRRERGSDTCKPRSVPAPLLSNLGAQVADLHERGILVSRVASGGASSIELASRVLTHPLPEDMCPPAGRVQVLQDIEEATIRWRTTHGRDRESLVDRAWLREHKDAIKALRGEHVLIDSEELFLATSERAIASASGRRVNAGLVMALAGVSAFWFVSDSRRNDEALKAAMKATASAAAQASEAQQLAEARARLVARLEEEQFTGFMAQGNMAVSKRDYGAAVKAFDQAEQSRANPDADLYRARGTALASLAKAAKSDEKAQLQDRAASDLRRWVEADPSTSRHLDAARLLLDAGDLTRAAEQLDAAAQGVKKEPPSALNSDRAQQYIQTLRSKNAISADLAAKWNTAFGKAPGGCRTFLQADARYTMLVFVPQANVPELSPPADLGLSATSKCTAQGGYHAWWVRLDACSDSLNLTGRLQPTGEKFVGRGTCTGNQATGVLALTEYTGRTLDYRFIITRH